VQFTDNVPNYNEWTSAAAQAIADLKAKFPSQRLFNDSAAIYIAAHGFEASQVVQQEGANNAAAMVAAKLNTFPLILWAANIANNSFKASTRPTLTLGVELDGLVRLSRMAIEYWRWFPSSDYGYKPVCILDGINHSQYTGNYTFKGDFTPEQNETEAQRRIGILTGAYVILNAADYDPAAAALSNRAKQVMFGQMLNTNGHVSNFIGALISEWSGRFCAEAQSQIIADAIPAEYLKRISTRAIVVQSEQEYDRISTSASIHGHFLNITTVVLSYNRTFCLYVTITFCLQQLFFCFSDIETLSNDPLKPIAPFQYACKMVDLNSILKQFDLPSSSYKVACQTVNDHILENLSKLVGYEQWERFEKSMKGFNSFVDTRYNSFSEWIKSKVEFEMFPDHLNMGSTIYEEDDETSNMGNIHCKFVSPTRIGEYIMFDSLRNL